MIMELMELSELIAGPNFVFLAANTESLHCTA